MIEANLYCIADVALLAAFENKNVILFPYLPLPTHSLTLSLVDITVE